MAFLKGKTGLQIVGLSKTHFLKSSDLHLLVIPDYAKFMSVISVWYVIKINQMHRCYVRAPTRSEMQETVKRVTPCFE
jgi:hypothetical protein